MDEQIYNVNCGFFDSIDHDRLYSADEMNRPYKRLINNGVFATPQGTPSTDLQVVSAANGMNIIVKRGEGLFADKWFENPSDLTITVPSNTNIVPRRDSVIVQVDKRQSQRVGNIVYRVGEPASYPLPPDIGTVDNVIEYRIANIYVAAGANYIGNDAITDLRGSDECLWVTSLIKQVDTSTLFNQWRAAYQNYYDTETEAFNAFMQSLTEELTVNTNIAKFESHYITSVDGETSIDINISGFNKSKDVLMVRINRLFASEGIDYVISNDSTKITLTKDIKANNNIDFIVLKSVVVGDTETVLQLLQALNGSISNLNTDVTALKSDSDWINFILETGTAFDSNNTPGVRKFGNMVSFRGAVKGVTEIGSTICSLPDSMIPSINHQFTSVAYASNGTISATCVIEVTTEGEIKLVAKSGTISATAKLSIATNYIVG